MSEVVRDIYIKRLREDLIGPADGENEIIDERPTDRYLTGILYPQNQLISPEEDEKLESESGKGINEGESSTDVSLSRTLRPATAGISFSLLAKGKPEINVRITCGTYDPFWIDSEQKEYEEKPANKNTKLKWRRKAISIDVPLSIEVGAKELDLSEQGLPEIFLYIKATKYGENLTVTLQAYNGNLLDENTAFYEKERATLFQFKMQIRPRENTILAARPVRGYASDEDTEISALIYRNTKEYATGHTCSAIWTENKSGVTSIETEWIPEQKVYSVDSNGDQIFNTEFEKNKIDFPTAKFLSESSLDSCLNALDILVGSFEKWLVEEEKIIDSLNDPFLIERAQKNIESARTVAVRRMKESINLLRTNKQAFEAFQLANRAMQIQASWKSTDGKGILKWRPFQLAFCLVTLHSLVDKKSDDRNTMDLIWFPTGGGKTEAYLLLTAFTLFFRRISADHEKSACGVAVFMRYTLRTLTIQQFERAAALIAACESIRKSSSKSIALLGETRFSIGLWVGGDSTPNNYAKAVACLTTNDEVVTPAQIKKCPACNTNLTWRCDDSQERVLALCSTSQCLGEIPVITVDDHIYDELPSLVIGTVDKFAQIVRKKEAVKLLGINTPHNPPDLIIQDELHLISGPLGTIVGIYETAIDKFCSLKGNAKPKIIGSTATIRRAKQQVNSLFHREAYQFPPPIINAENSCFAKIDPNSPGRIYVGITTAGRSEKFVLQAVAASLIQSLQDKSIDKNEADNFSTLVAYFNSLRVLGGALVVMQDDVEQALAAYAKRRNENKRNTNAPEEMTSRKTSKEIPEILARLKLSKNDSDFIDILLATNMLSVGVDIPRLGLMLVAGQPKTMSEYIQATSRVGRQNVPGLIVTMYNNNKTRDRAHYESFKTWHQSLYRELEGSSVTPFAARARDKALHAPLIVLARHLIDGMSDNPVLTPELREKIENQIVPYILERVGKIDGRELKDTELQINEILQAWEDRDGLQHYWTKKKNTLLVSADDVAQLYAAYSKKAEGISTPNTMRNVEAQTKFFLKEYSKPYESRTGTDNE